MNGERRGQLNDLTSWNSSSDDVLKFLQKCAANVERLRKKRKDMEKEGVCSCRDVSFVLQENPSSTCNQTKSKSEK
jgi:hypothetical protein